VEFSATAVADLDEVSVSSEVELEMVRNFWDLLIPKAVAAPLECLDEALAGEAHLRLTKQGLRVSCTFGPAPGLGIQSTLSPAAVATLLAEPHVNYMGESLTSRRAALAATPVALDCCLGSVQVPVRDLHSLRIGDVLVTDIALDGQAELRVRSKPRSIVAGRIGVIEGRKAIKVETAQVVTANRGLRR
jgi:flagellar motor switch/type III secretory pathway protein FliN